MLAVNRILYVFAIIYAVLTVFTFVFTRSEAEPTIAFRTVFYGFLGLLLITSIVSFIIGQGRVRTIHRVLPLYYLVKLPMMIGFYALAFIFASNESIFEITAMVWIGLFILLVGAVLQLLVFVEALWAAVMLVISWKEK